MTTKDQIRDGLVPDQFRNDALPLWLDDGGIALVFYAAPEVRRYGADGSLLWSRTLVDPVFDEAFAEFVRRNTAETNPAQLYSLNYFADAFSSGDELWLLLNTVEGQPAVILILESTTGEPKAGGSCRVPSSRDRSRSMTSGVDCTSPGRRTRVWRSWTCRSSVRVTTGWRVNEAAPRERNCGPGQHDEGR